MSTVYAILLALWCIITPGALSIKESKNITDFIRGQGYPIETHTVLTDDFWQLVLHRIPYGIKPPQNTSAPRPVVFLMHGLTDASAGWCMNQPHESLAYILADNGYDVWIGNNRGNGYSMQHKLYKPDSKHFWDFSYDEMAIFDFPANIEYILNTTGQPKLSYIGHSQGTIQAFAGLVTNPTLGDKLNLYIAIAPVAFVGNLAVKLFSILAHLDAQQLLAILGWKEFFVSQILHKVLPSACKLEPSLCNYGGSFFYGPDNYLNASRLDFYTEFEPFPTSAKNIMHWAQGIDSRSFQRFDYGIEGNLQHYQQPIPPQYKLRDFPPNLPLVLFNGGVDGLADPPDVQLLMEELPMGNVKVYSREDYGHVDPLLGIDAWQTIYPQILKELALHQS